MIFAFKIINTPQITKNPKIISTGLTFLLKKIGSIKEAKKAPVENIAKVIEIFDCSIASKKVIQCRAIITPAIENFNKFFVLIIRL